MATYTCLIKPMDNNWMDFFEDDILTVECEPSEVQNKVREAYADHHGLEPSTHVYTMCRTDTFFYWEDREEDGGDLVQYMAIDMENCPDSTRQVLTALVGIE